MKSRLRLFAAVGAVWVLGVAGRLYQLQVVRHDHYVAKAAAQQHRVVELDPPRGTIYDARGRELAVSIEVPSYYAVPSAIEDPAAAAKALAEQLDLNPKKLKAEISDRSKGFVWIKRKLDPREAEAMRKLKIKGVDFVTESKRYYPMKELAAQVLGFVGTENHGLAGLEQYYDATVAGKPGRRTVLRDARRGTVQAPTLSFNDPEPGRDLHLTLDAAIQHIVERELERAIVERGAKQGSAVILDPRTGGILALATYPTFDPNRHGEFPPSRWKNRAVADVFEPGSTFKMVTAAAALTSGVISADDVYDCEMGGIWLSGVFIKDHKEFGNLTFAQAIANSSNVAMVKASMILGDERLQAMTAAFGFGDKTRIDLPGESAGINHPISYWHTYPRHKAYVAFGQGVAVTPIQLATAVAAIANDGARLEPFLVSGVGRNGEIEQRREGGKVVARPVSAEIAREVGRLLEGVIVEGTGKSAQIKGYRLAGKTGTAQIAVAGGYDPNHYIPGFVGYAPVGAPVIAGMVAVDEPRGAAYHGGQVAAPLFGAIAKQVLLYLGVRPEREQPNWPGGKKTPQELAIERGALPVVAALRSSP